MTTFNEAWKTRTEREFEADNLTRTYRDVMLVMPMFRGHGGEIFPSHEAIAKRANCSTRTVERALAEARDLGMVHWMPRRKRQGWRSLQTSNRYFLNVPAAPVIPGQRAPFPRRATARQNVEGKVEVSKQEAFQGMLRDAAAAGDLIKRRQEAYNAGKVTLQRSPPRATLLTRR